MRKHVDEAASAEQPAASGWEVQEPVVRPADDAGRRGGRGRGGELGTDAGSGQQGSAAGDAAGETTSAGQSESAETESAESPAAESTVAVHPARTVALGVLFVLCLVYCLVWMSWAKPAAAGFSQAAASSGTVGSVLQQVAFWLAPIAPLLWFVTTLQLTRGSSFRVRFGWLVLGAIVVFPYPFLAGLGA